MTAEQATTAVQTAYFARVALRVGHHGYSVSPHHFHSALGGLDSAVQTALTAPADTTVALTPTLDAKRVAKWVKTLAKKTYRAPVAGRRDPPPQPPVLHAFPSGPRPAAVPDADEDPASRSWAARAR